MATLYVSSSGSGTAPYDTWAKASTSVQTAIDAASTAGDIVEIETGTYTGILSLGNSGTEAAPIIIRQSIESGHTGDVTITATGNADELIDTTAAVSWVTFQNIDFVQDDTPANNILLSGDSNIVFEGCSFDMPRRLFITNSLPVTFNSCTFSGCGSTSLTSFYIDGTSQVFWNDCILQRTASRLFEYCRWLSSATGYFNRCEFRGLGNTTTHKAAFEVGATGGSTCVVTYNACKFTPHQDQWFGRNTVNSGATANIYNCFFSGMNYEIWFMQNLGTATLNFKNNIVGAFNMQRSSTANVIENYADPGSTAVIESNFFIPYWNDPEDATYLADIAAFGVTNQSGAAVKLTAQGVNEGYVCLTCDDATTTSTTHALALAAMANPKGIPVTWYIDQFKFVDEHSNSTEIAQNWVADGNEIGIHSYTVQSWTATDAFTVTGTGTTPTIDVDVAGDIITCTDVENGAQTVSGFANKTFGEIRAEIDAFTGWSTAASAVPNAAQGFSIADTSGAQAAGGGYVVLLDRTGISQGWFKSQIADPKAYFELITGQEVKTCRPVNLAHGEDEVTAVIDAGFLGMSSSAVVEVQLNDLEIFEVTTFGTTSNTFPDTSEAGLTRAGVAIGTHAVETGALIVVMAHAPEQEANELTMTQKEYLIDAILSVSGVSMPLISTVFERIRDSGLWVDADADGKRWTRTLTDSSDLTPLPGSPVIGSGQKWWAGAEPIGIDGEPFSDMDTDVGPIQSTESPLHPVSL